MPDSLALRAGLVKGDIIEAVNGERLEETGDLRFWLRDL
ncbi:MAG: PDZ domain-containing protein, partial [Thermodesulfobacteriota bacterium]